ncbi:MAG TPA: hypothetical protein DCS93_37160 [Microscillaceae bacterium]|nr:hypothetical protein [Microscillaceae bacterium]
MENIGINLVVLLVGVILFLILSLTQQRKIAFANVETFMQGLASNFNLHLQTSYGWLNRFFNEYPSVYSLHHGQPMQAFISEKIQGSTTEHYFCILLESNMYQFPEVSIEKKTSLRSLVQRTFRGQKTKSQNLFHKYSIKSNNSAFASVFLQNPVIQKTLTASYSDIRGKFEIKQGTIQYRELVQLPELQHNNQERLGRLMQLVQKMAAQMGKMN